MTGAKPEGLALLRQPFPAHQISKLPKQMKKDDPDRGRCERGSRYSADGHECGGWHARSIHLDYVGHAALTDRLLDADPGWSWEPVAFAEDGLPRLDKLGGLWIRLTVCGVTRLGYGDAQGKTGPNAVKEAIGDALRNAAMRFGAALDLWHKGELHADEAGSSPPAVEPAHDGAATPGGVPAGGGDLAALKKAVVAAGKAVGLRSVAALTADYARRNGGQVLAEASADELAAYRADLLGEAEIAALGEHADEQNRAEAAADA